MELLRAVKIKKSPCVQGVTTNEKTPSVLFLDIMDDYSESLYRFCRNLTYSKEDAEDLFQETFLRVFEQTSKINESDKLQSFLFSTALFIWKSWKRKYARRSRIAPIVPFDDSVDSCACVEESFLAQEEKLIVRKLVEALPEKYKIPIILYYSAEMNVTEIASALKIPSGTVKSRLFKGRKLIEKGLVATYDKE